MLTDLLHFPIIMIYRRTSVARTLMAHQPCLIRTCSLGPERTLYTETNPWLELIVMVPSLFELLKFYCTIVYMYFNCYKPKSQKHAMQLPCYLLTALLHFPVIMTYYILNVINPKIKVIQLACTSLTTLLHLYKAKISVHCMP